MRGSRQALRTTNIRKGVSRLPARQTKMMNIPQKIDGIIAQRMSKLPNVELMQQRLEQIGATVQKLDIICQEAACGKNGNLDILFQQDLEIKEKLALINTKKFHDSYGCAQESLQQLKNRFSRKQVHISFVGRAGQGKSLVMQKISGLSGDIIPSSDGDDCTGAKSIITNRADSEISAEIHFYSRMEYVDVVNKYLSEIFDDNLYEVSSVDEITLLRQKNLESKLDEKNVRKKSLLTHLMKYINHSDEVVPLLGQKMLVPADEIECYVAQYSHKDRERRYYKYLGVKYANIMCHFPFEQCGKIVLVDTIGLGDTALDIREKMLQTVSEDSDAILMISKPDANRPHIEQYDIDIIEAISDKVTADYVQKMLFWVINRVSEGKGENVEGVIRIINNLKKSNYPIAGCMNVDCMDSGEVENKLLMPVLETLSNNLAQIDEMLLKGAEKQLEELYRSYHDIAVKMEHILKASINDDMRRQFKKDIEGGDGKPGIIGRMTNSIRNLYAKEPYGKLRNQACEKLYNAAEEKLRNILRCVPEKKTVLDLLNDGTMTKHDVYIEFTNQMRLFIINDFLELNGTLQELVDEMKNHIIDCLADEEQGRLEYLVPRQSKDADVWLQELIGYLEKDDNTALIVEALRKLIEFNLRMENFLIYRVRAHLDSIDISLQSQSPQITGEINEKEKIAGEIIFWLKHNLEIVYQEIRKELIPLYSYPNNTLWAEVKDFYDRIVYARNREKGDDVETDWRYLYEDAIPYIWPEKCRDYLAQKGVAEEWNVLVKEIHRYDKLEMFRFGTKEV